MMNNYETFTNEERRQQEATAFNAEIDQRENLPPANIIVAGITGTGKSTLLNAMFGEEMAATGVGKPITENINEYNSEKLPIHIWDTMGLEIDSKRTGKSIEDIRKIIDEKSLSSDKYDRIHAIWYCINSNSNRYQGAELKFIKRLHANSVPFIIVLTQCSGAEEQVNAFERKIREINESEGMSDIETIQVLAKDHPARGFTIPAFGLENLVDLTMKKLPDFIKNGFVAAQKVSKIQKRVQCEKIIADCVRNAKEGFWDKIPIANIIAANNRLRYMFGAIGGIYNTNLKPNHIADIITELEKKRDFARLLNPFDMKYNNQIIELLTSKEQDQDGEWNPLINKNSLKDRHRVAAIVAFYGYTFIDSIEKTWDKWTEEEVEDVDKFCDLLKQTIQKILIERTGQA
ncbi:MAG: GTPase domain-containing protein [Oscillospiraceae bacterium]|nr:GTPase domain-containing protein [Oscillospiraceae bacterium]